MFRRFFNWLAGILLLHKMFDLVCQYWPCRYVNRIPPCWIRIPKFWRHVITNIIIGMAIAIGLLFFQNTSYLRDIEDSGMDWMMAMFKGTEPKSPTVPLAFLDIDEKTYRYWGEPFYTPRGPLVDIIEYARSGNPALIFLDVEIANIGYVQEDDLKFKTFIDRYPVDAPPLILVRTFRSSLNQFPEQRASFLESSVSANKNVFWASTLFNRDSDLSIRRWNLWVKSVEESGDQKIVPSVQLICTVLLKGKWKDQPSKNSIISAQLNKLASLPEGSSINLAGIEVSPKLTSLGQRIFFTIPYIFTKDQKSPLVTSTGGQKTPLFQTRSVMPLVQPHKTIDASWLSERVVVIGASYADSRDLHHTPIGEMPGSMILINSIHSYWQNGEIKPLSKWAKLFIELLLITIMSLAFARFNSFWGMVISGGVIILLLLPFSFWFFRFGVWLDFAIPLMAVQLHQIAAEFEENIENRKVRGGN
jgi:CHASE2 domain-containing sensor protein